MDTNRQSLKQGSTAWYNFLFGAEKKWAEKIVKGGFNSLFPLCLVVLLVSILAWPRGVFGYGADGPGTPSEYQGPPVAAVCLVNQTDARLIYGVVWGAGPVTNHTLEPRNAWVHYWKYSEANVAAKDFRRPPPTVRFDSDFTEGIRWVSYSVMTYLAQRPDCRASKQYAFQYSDPSRRTLVLVEIYSSQ